MRHYCLLLNDVTCISIMLDCSLKNEVIASSEHCSCHTAKLHHLKLKMWVPGGGGFVKTIIHSFVWVYWDQLDANCLVLFYYTFFTLHVSDVIYIHPQERHIMYMQMIQVSARVS